METRALMFQHRVSRGSRFNQIYIPGSMSSIFEVGDLVEVQLVKKKEQTYYSETLKKIQISEFKKNLIRQIFSLLSGFNNIKQIFIIGSFLTEKADYRDIDILLISDEKGIEEKIYDYLSEKLQVKFHILAIPAQKFLELLKICPLTRSMVYYFVSNKAFELSEEIEFNKNHLKFLLMMPEDLIKLSLSNGRVYFDALRRIIAIKRFLGKQKMDSVKINEELKIILGDYYSLLKNNESFDKEILNFVHGKIKDKLVEVNKLLKSVK